MYTKNKSQKACLPAVQGFSLIELLVVMAIIGLLSTIVFAALDKAGDKARYATMVGTFQQIELAARLFLTNEKFYPCDVPPNQDPGTGPVPSEENKYCVSKGLVQTKLLSKWPRGPCPGWEYDWENWSNLVALPTGTAKSHIVRISLRHDAAAGWPTAYYYCIKDTHGSTTFSCGGNTSDHGYTFNGGIKVNYIHGGSLACF